MLSFAALSFATLSLGYAVINATHVIDCHWASPSFIESPSMTTNGYQWLSMTTNDHQ